MKPKRFTLIEDLFWFLGGEISYLEYFIQVFRNIIPVSSTSADVYRISILIERVGFGFERKQKCIRYIFHPFSYPQFFFLLYGSYFPINSDMNRISEKIIPITIDYKSIGNHCLFLYIFDLRNNNLIQNNTRGKTTRLWKDMLLTIKRKSSILVILKRSF